jgi:hypothetical protein
VCALSKGDAETGGFYPARVREIVATERLRLREFELDDVDSLFEVLGDPGSMRYYPAPFDRDRVAAWIEGARRSYRQHGFGLWGVIRRSDGRFLGDCGPMLQSVDGELIPEVGYHIVPPERGRGYATERRPAPASLGSSPTRASMSSARSCPPTTRHLALWPRKSTARCASSPGPSSTRRCASTGPSARAVQVLFPNTEQRLHL